MACEDIQNDLEGLFKEREDWSSELLTASTGRKAYIAAQIKRITVQIGIKRQELDACLVANNVTPIAVTLTGSATLTTTNPSAPGPSVNPVTIGLFFSAGRTSFAVTSFAPITTSPAPTPFGPNTTTVKLLSAGIGSFDHATGNMAITISLLFDQSIDLPVIVEDSTFIIPLGTGSVGTLIGSPLNPSTKRVMLVGVGTFQGGFLGGSSGALTINGTLSPLP